MIVTEVLFKNRCNTILLVAVHTYDTLTFTIKPNHNLNHKHVMVRVNSRIEKGPLGNVISENNVVAGPQVKKHSSCG